MRKFRSRCADALGLAGSALIVVGAAEIAPALGWIVGGLATYYVSWRLTASTDWKREA